MGQTMRTKKGWKEMVSYLFLSGLIIGAMSIAIFPVFWVFLSSIKHEVDVFVIPPRWVFQPTLQNYIQVIIENPVFVRCFMNSVIIAVSTTVISVIIGSLAGYALARFRFWGGEILPLSILFVRMVPYIMLMLPLFLMMKSFGLLDTQIALIMVHTAFNLPLVTWLMRGFFMAIPPELEESAMIDGCSRFGALLRIVFPLVKTGLVTVIIFCMLLSWNEFMSALTLTSRDAKTLPIAIKEYIRPMGILWTEFCAFAILMLAPLIISSSYIQKYLVSGLTEGSVKQ